MGPARHVQRLSKIQAGVDSRWVVAANSSPSTTARNTELGIFVNSHFDSGNIEVEDITDPTNIRLNIHKDPFCHGDNKAHFQWFNFRMTGVRDKPLTLNIMNAGQASFPPAWIGYDACASYDLDHWFSQCLKSYMPPVRTAAATAAAAAAVANFKPWGCHKQKHTHNAHAHCCL
eukprot:jgi/Chrzof1/10596/Cz05g04230.t1